MKYFLTMLFLLPVQLMAAPIDIWDTLKLGRTTYFNVGPFSGSCQGRVKLLLNNNIHFRGPLVGTNAQFKPGTCRYENHDNSAKVSWNVDLAFNLQQDEECAITIHPTGMELTLGKIVFVCDMSKPAGPLDLD